MCFLFRKKTGQYQGSTELFKDEASIVTALLIFELTFYSTFDSLNFDFRGIQDFEN